MAAIVSDLLFSGKKVKGLAWMSE